MTTEDPVAPKIYADLIGVWDCNPRLLDYGGISPNSPEYREDVNTWIAVHDLTAEPFVHRIEFFKRTDETLFALIYQYAKRPEDGCRYREEHYSSTKRAWEGEAVTLPAWAIELTAEDLPPVRLLFEGQSAE
jgi:hypothetical protein